MQLFCQLIYWQFYSSLRIFFGGDSTLSIPFPSYTFV